MKTILLTLIIGGLGYTGLRAQSKLRPNFDAAEYRDMLQITIRQLDPELYPYPDMLNNEPNYKRVYISAESGLQNQWEFWLSPNNVGIISIRGTVPKEKDSWLANLYSGMVSAQGKIKIDDNQYLDYKLAEDSNAAVHAGWLIGMSAIAPDIVEKINTYYAQGIKDYIIIGHSQGGSIGYLLRSYLHYMTPALPRDVTIKSYHSAAPKPGNQFYAYDFNIITQSGWAYHIINTEDWVPNLPPSVQTIADMNETSPFLHKKELLKKLPFIQRRYMNHVYNKLDRKSTKSQKAYTKYLGKKTYKLIHKSLPEYEELNYVNSFNYVNCGSPIVLRPGQNYWNNYFKKYYDDYKFFTHHHFYAYYLLSLETFPERG